MYDKEYNKAVRSAALQCNLTDEQAKAILDTMWKQLRENFSSADLDDPESFNNVRLIGLGMFYSTEQKRKNFNDYINRDRSNEH